MNFLIVGLGSMGKRRVRCLKTLGYKNSDIAGFDVREDRRKETEQKYGIKTYSDIENALDAENPSVFVISVPPDFHHIYMKTAIEKGIHFFVEASVVDTDMDIIKEKLRNTDITAAPSATLLFHPAVKIIAEII
ncbi:MAG TPA: Gfo/Idh/MocA family oxidoreductase, partial [Desulfobacterales bacterium]|nr:Gfo/Idh/MocA family oxidoreductase [Desulfobacterales bacterium]